MSEKDASDLRRRDVIKVNQDGEKVAVYNWATVIAVHRVRGNNPVSETLEVSIGAGDSRVKPNAVTEWLAEELRSIHDIYPSERGIKVVDIGENLDEVYY